MERLKKLYIVTGFLGAGKTTLMKRLIAHFADYLLFVIVNEFGDGIDGTLIRETGAAVLEINNGSIFCSCRSDQFLDALNAALTSAADIVLVETSGLSDPTGMSRLMDIAAEKSGPFEFCGTIVMADACSFIKTLNTAAAVKQQILSGGLILVNKTDKAGPEQTARVINEIKAINPIAEIKQTVYAAFEPDSLDKLPQAHVKGGISRHTLGVRTIWAKIPINTPEDKLRCWLNSFAGDTWRIKGVVSLDTGLCFIDATDSTISFSDAPVMSKKQGATDCRAYGIDIIWNGSGSVFDKIKFGWLNVFGTEIKIIADR